MGAKRKKRFVGIDWASRHNDVCIVDAAGELIAERRFANSADGMADMLAWLAKHNGGRVKGLGVAIEVPHGPVVDALMERGAAVFSINPKQAERFRSRFSVSGVKDDQVDARVLADSLRTDQRAYRRVAVRHPVRVELTEWSRADRELKRQRVDKSNRLRTQLQRYFPQYLELSNDMTVEWLLAVWEIVPTPKHAKRATPSDVTAVMRKHLARKLNGEQVLKVLRTKPLVVAPGTQAAAVAHIGLLIESLRLLNKQIRQAKVEIDRCLEALEREQRDVKILQSLPGVGRIVLATLLTEGYEPLAQQDYHALRALAGSAPVTRRSGRSRQVSMRRACQPRLRDAVYHWARIASMIDPRTKARYDSLRARGKTHGRALRTVSDRLLKVACKMLETETLYDPSRYAPLNC